MLFNSFGFLFFFLPIVLAGFFWIAKRSELFAAAWLAAASLFFYAWWDYRYLPLLLISIVINYCVGLQIAESASEWKKRWLIGGVVFDLSLLAYYKYAGFFTSIVTEFSNLALDFKDVILPIGISFFTFTQIAYLVDTCQGKVKEYRFIHYLLFVTYFPHLIAGPVLHHKEMMPQFADSNNYKPSFENFSVGAFVFIIGLVKKVLIADNLAPYANDLFSSSAAPSFLMAWGGVLAYAFQIYFDFSGYSDMAIGLSRLFGVKLPLNFNSPYKSENIVEFWRRWHMTLSRFLRDYLYIALGGNRYGLFRRYTNLMVTMLLGGLWHGAGWNYLIWGGLHGIYLIVNHAWQAAANRSDFSPTGKVWKLASSIITFLAVCFAWVFFRAVDLNSAEQIIFGLVGKFGIGIPNAIAAHLGASAVLLENFGVKFFLGGGTRFVETWLWVAGAAFIAFFLPNTQQMARGFFPALDFVQNENLNSSINIVWKPNRSWALVLSVFAVFCLLSLNKPSDFLYFQF
ncbi:MBOAT family O-acyltransferase [Methylomonas koyamae]|uniref:MBOAT family O-acyltransferase n=1 Tax=Methylomonas koyamae TaxID=702114 RepID=UPI002872EB69|nr:MBOAT family protein [Methylomonas koyamae]WNB77499.1 MBOAT family protein [Methylomonas koyamae]